VRYSSARRRKFLLLSPYSVVNHVTFVGLGLSVACYCIASIVMTVVNKVCPSFLDAAATAAMTNAETGAVHCLRT
jgi:hypothetical protein